MTFPHLEITLLKTRFSHINKFSKPTESSVVDLTITRCRDWIQGSL